MKSPTFNPLVSQHIVEYDKFTNVLSPQRFCNSCGGIIWENQPLFADECFNCWESHYGWFSDNGWCGLANHINAKWPFEDYIGMMIQYEYAIDCDYT